VCVSECVCVSRPSEATTEGEEAVASLALLIFF
jgi:hypothetical protein